MAASNTDHFIKVTPMWSSTIGSGGVADGVVDTIPLSSTTNLPTDTAIELVINRVDSNGQPTGNYETVRGVVSGTNLVSCVRGVEGTAQAWSAGVVVEMLATADIQNRMVDGILTEHNQDGTHKPALVTTLKATGAEINTGTEDGKIVTPKAIKDANLPYEGKATGSDVNTGTNETKYVSSKAIADSKIVSTAKAINNNEAITQKDSGGTAREVLKVDSSNNLIVGTSALNGLLSYPQSAVLVWANTTQSIPSGIRTKVTTLNTVSINTNNEWNATDKKFVAKAPGIYLAGGSVYYTDTGVSPVAIEVGIFKNGNFYRVLTQYQPQYGQVFFTTLVSLNKDDYLELYTGQSTGSNKTLVNDGNGVFFLCVKIF